jgi:cobalamin biosynthesis Co2+ chelatase CbiK
VKEDFESKLGALWVQMMAKVQVVLAPFLAFTSFYNANKAYNMSSLMLDPCFKSLDVVKAFVGCAKVIQIVAEYDSKTLLPLLVVAFHFLNPTIDGLIKATLVDDNSIFRAMASNAVTLHGVVKE